MKIGIVLLCRYDSKRLPGKILKNIHGRTVLSYIVERIRLAAPNAPLVVATSSAQCDDVIEAYCQRALITCFRGSHDDVAGRFLACAESFGLDFAVRINGDNIFVDPDTLLSMMAIAGTGTYDFVTNVPGRTFPFGMSVEIVRTAFYRETMSGVTDVQHREHVTSRLYEMPVLGNRYIFTNTSCPEATGLHLALDTVEDLEKITHMIERSGPSPATLKLSDLHKLAVEKANPTPWRGSCGPLLIAEIGGNHEGDFEVARQMTESAISSGADCVKFQLYRGATLVSPVESPDRYKHFQKFELTRNQHIELAEMCRAANVAYMASVWDMEMLEWIDPYLDIYKVGSGDLTAWPILREFARRGKPILLSTGLANMDEVLQTVRQIQAVNSDYRNPEMLCIMQCTSMYPIPDSDANLRVMDSLRTLTGVSVGYSDHTVGEAALRTAAAMGAQALEFHFTLTREGKTFRDHQVSLVASEVLQLKADISQITAFRGSCFKTPQKSELENKHEISFRRAAYTNRLIIAGEKIREADLVFLRPAHGTDARDSDNVRGAIALRDIEPFRAIQAGVDYSVTEKSTL